VIEDVDEFRGGEKREVEEEVLKEDRSRFYIRFIGN